MAGLQALLDTLYPPQCIGCGAAMVDPHALCGECWRDTGFITGTVCDGCGVPLPGEADALARCDDCLRIARPWAQGRAVLSYGGTGRGLVLRFKHGDRLDLARPLGDWMAQAAAPILRPGMLVAPVPLHWFRLLRRRYNQAALLSDRVAKAARLDHLPDLLQRIRATPTQDGKGREGRFANVARSIRVHPARRHQAEGRHVLLVDDVMTSGATLAACAEAVLVAGAADVSVLVLARVARPEGGWV